MFSSCSKDGPAAPPADDEKAITSFVIKRADGRLFNRGDYTVSLRRDTFFGLVPPATDLNGLIAEIRYMGARITPDMGPQDFSQPVKYTVIARDSSKHEYTVIVKNKPEPY